MVYHPYHFLSDIRIVIPINTDISGPNNTIRPTKLGQVLGQVLRRRARLAEPTLVVLLWVWGQGHIPQHIMAKIVYPYSRAILDRSYSLPPRSVPFPTRSPPYLVIN
ncbi:hypothetical protein FKM82_028550 [Ascaphus truei]